MPIALTSLIMSPSKMYQRIKTSWPSIKQGFKQGIKQILLLLLTFAIMITIALIPMSIVWGFNLQDTAFLVLVIGDIVVIAIFIISFLAIAIRFIIKDVTKSEELICDSCGEDLDKGLICLNCGFNNRKILNSK